jgi:hypothetical protein
VDYPDRNEELNYVPDDGIVVSGAREIEIMEADRIRNGKFVS